jgi:hypothetical protein
MQSKTLLVMCSAALSLGLAAPAFAQTSGGSMSGRTSMDKGGPTGSMDSHGASISGRGHTMGTPATEGGTGPNERPGKTDNPSGAPQNDNMSK